MNKVNNQKAVLCPLNKFELELDIPLNIYLPVRLFKIACWAEVQPTQESLELGQDGQTKCQGGRAKVGQRPVPRDLDFLRIKEILLSKIENKNFARYLE